MTKEEYINLVKNELGFLPPSELNEASEYFNSYFCTPEPDEVIISRLGEPRKAAATFYKNRKKDEEESNVPYEWIMIPVWILIIPLAVPIALLAALAAFCIIAAAMLLIIAIIAACVGMWLYGFYMVVSAIPLHVIMADKLLQCGTGFLMFGAGAILTYLVIRWYAKMFPWIVSKIAAAYRKHAERKNSASEV